MRTRPPNCRLFIGNLASERTSKQELRDIFIKYGEIIEDPVIRRCFGFVQFDNPESAQNAIQAENGRLIGHRRIELSLADNREPRYKNGPEERREERRNERPGPYSSNDRRRPQQRGGSRNGRSKERNKDYSDIQCQLVYSNRDDESIISRTQGKLRDIGIDGKNKYFQRNLSSISPVIEDAYRKNIPFLLFVNCGDPSIYDLHMILPPEQASTYRGLSLDDAINIMRENHHRTRSVSQPPSYPGGNAPRDYPSRPPPHWHPGMSRSNYMPSSAPYPPGSSAYPPNSGPPYHLNDPYAGGYSQPLRPSSSSYYPRSVEPHPSSNANSLAPNPYPPMPERTGSARDPYSYDYKPAPPSSNGNYQNNSVPSNPPTNTPMDPQQLSNLLRLLQAQGGTIGPPSSSSYSEHSPANVYSPKYNPDSTYPNSTQRLPSGTSNPPNNYRSSHTGESRPPGTSNPNEQNFPTQELHDRSLPQQNPPH